MRDPVASLQASLGPLTVVPGPVTTLQLVLPPSAVAGQVQTGIVQALDAVGNVVTTHVTAIALAFSDAAALYPANILMRAPDHGAQTFALTPRAAGAQTLVANDLFVRAPSRSPSRSCTALTRR